MKYVLVLGLFFMLIGCGSAPVSVPATPANTAPISPELQTLLALVNDVRSKGYDCGTEGKFAATEALTLDTRLTSAAQKHSVDLEASGITKNMHVSPQDAINYKPGMTFTGRISAEGYKWINAGENAAWGFSSPETVMKAWLDSPGHCKNILSPKFTAIGLGRAGSYWTQVFAAPL